MWKNTSFKVKHALKKTQISPDSAKSGLRAAADSKLPPPRPERDNSQVCT